MEMDTNTWKRRGERERERDIWLAGIDLYFERNGKRS